VVDFKRGKTTLKTGPLPEIHQAIVSAPVKARKKEDVGDHQSKPPQKTTQKDHHRPQEKTKNRKKKLWMPSDRSDKGRGGTLASNKFLEEKESGGCHHQACGKKDEHKGRQQPHDAQVTGKKSGRWRKEDYAQQQPDPQSSANST